PSGGLTLFASDVKPAVPSVPDAKPVELGVKFTSDRRGEILGVRFFKGSGDTGSHIVNLWTSEGTLLASEKSLAETASGWQQVNFQSPVIIQAGTTYVASYHTDVGNYAATNDFFANGIDSPPLHAPADEASGGNGVYAYG